MSLVIHFDKENLQKQIENNEKIINDPSFWDNQKKALELVNEQNKIKEIFSSLNNFENIVKELEDTLSLLKESYDEEMHEIVSNEMLELEKNLSSFQTSVLLNGEFDDCAAIIEIHPGAGGTESQDWANMLLRMYGRFADFHRMKMTILNLEEASDAGIKSASFILKGKNAYGLLKSERGVHRLVRISPFDSSGRRHTSFASVDVVPQMEKNIDIVIEEKDIRIDTYRSSGAGGQNVNKTDSAVRITHIPTGIVVTCQNERSQIQNREIAFNILKSRLYQLEVEAKQKELDSIRGVKSNIEWGSQIRSYVFCPYTMVKDHRSGYEQVDVFNVLDGALDAQINAYLKWEIKRNAKN